MKNIADTGPRLFTKGMQEKTSKKTPDLGPQRVAARFVLLAAIFHKVVTQPEEGAPWLRKSPT